MVMADPQPEPEPGPPPEITVKRNRKQTAIPPRRYIQKADEFLAHWPLVNVALGTPLILTGNYTVASLTTDRGQLLTNINALVAAQNLGESAITDRDAKRANLRERIRQFNAVVRGFFPNSIYANQLPKVPQMNDPMGVWIVAMEEVANTWSQINAITPVPVGAPIPLLLTGGYTRATFVIDQTAMIAAFTAIETHQTSVETAILVRDQLWFAMWERFKQYRQAVTGRFAVGAPLLDSLPTITPPAGHTPDGVNIAGAWDATLVKGVITFTASTDPDLYQYELRACFGNRYDTDTEQVIGNLPAGAPVLRFETDQGLVAPGSRVFYKVYVILTTLNEKGSRSVSITRT